MAQIEVIIKLSKSDVVRLVENTAKALIKSATKARWVDDGIVITDCNGESSDSFSIELTLDSSRADTHYITDLFATLTEGDRAKIATEKLVDKGA